MTETTTLPHLGETLADLRDKYAKMLKPEIGARMDAHIEQLRAAGIRARALRAGAKLPDFSLQDATGQTMTSSALLARGPLVISFYRGTWCPYCNAELDALRAAADAFRAAGAQLVVLSPQHPDKRDVEFIAKLPFPVLYDRDNAVAKAFGLAYAFTDDLRDVYLNIFKNDIAAINGVSAWELPVPARYVVGRDGTIRTAHVDPDYRYRPEVSITLDELAALG